jgi:UDP-N-acetyl-D-glucosamine dehydrogenase
VALEAADALYRSMVVSTVRVSSTATAEAVKLTENIFRCVNIALVNELKLVYGAMGIDIWEVIEAAKSKPFGFMPFYPGPGLGGHCIPIDPFYLSWKAREYGLSVEFIRLAGEVNRAMPEHVVQTVGLELDRRFGRSLDGSKILLIGLAYKKNIDDIRESPSLTLIALLERRGALVDYHDPHVAEIMRTRAHADLSDRRSVELSPTAVAAYDCVLIATDHDVVDYEMLVDNGKLVVDARNACCSRGLERDNVCKA